MAGLVPQLSGLIQLSCLAQAGHPVDAVLSIMMQCQAKNFWLLDHPLSRMMTVEAIGAMSEQTAVREARP
jgi:hypothetical protein